MSILACSVTLHDCIACISALKEDRNIPMEHTNRILFFDNLYTSPALCRHLQRVGIRACGTVRTNRAGLPLKSKLLKAVMRSLEDGQTVSWQSGDLGCLAWRDNKSTVLILSTHRRVDTMAS